MGRMLEALRRAKPDAIPSEPIAVVQTECEPEVEPEVPFIEIGAPGTPVDASAAVLATGPIPESRLPHRLILPAAKAARSVPGAATFQLLPEAKQAPLAPALIAFHEPEHPVSRQYRELLAGLRQALVAREPQVLLFVPAGSGIGATTAVLNLAITAAREGKGRMALVDANLPQPGMAKLLGLPEAPGLAEFLAGKAGLDEAVRETGQEGLWVLTAGTADVAHDVGVLADKTAPLLGQLRDEFDLLLVESPTWQTGGVPALAAAADALFLVLPQREADLATTKSLIASVRRQARRPSGMILTQS